MENILKAVNEIAYTNDDVNNFNSTNIMNDIIDFSSVLGEGAVAKTATVDQKVVNDLFNAFMKI